MKLPYHAESAILRTFHPVGQGAFYSERHSNPEREFSIVYDCGSSTLKAVELERRVKSSFPKNRDIDILFISHFHDDHINGIKYLAEHCNIKKVILPFIHKNDHAFVRVENFLEHGIEIRDIVAYTINLLGAETAVFVMQEQTVDFAVEPQVVDTGEAIDIRGEALTSQTFNSGTVFAINNDSDWYYVPFNYRHSERILQFKQALENEGVTIDEINAIEDIGKYKRKLRNAYNKVEGGLNSNSLIVFSGPSNPYEIMSHKSYHCACHSCCPHPGAGCLFFGDMNLNEKRIVGNLKSRLGQLSESVGAIQVAHHGSIMNHHESVFNFENITTAIISYGQSNRYGHPSGWVIGELISAGITPILVTENQRSIFIQYQIN